MILELVEPYLEVINLVIALIIVVLGLRVSSVLEGKLKNAWNYLLVAILLFGIHEIIGSLAEFSIFKIEGLYAFTEFLFIVAFLMAVLLFRKLFLELSKKVKK